MRSLGPCRSSSTPIGRPTFGLDGADRVQAGPWSVMRAVAEIEAEHVGARLEKGWRMLPGGD